MVVPTGYLESHGRNPRYSLSANISGEQTRKKHESKVMRRSYINLQESNPSSPVVHILTNSQMGSTDARRIQSETSMSFHGIYGRLVDKGFSKWRRGS